MRGGGCKKEKGLIWSFRGFEQVRRLVANGASPSACDYDRRSPLHLACCTGDAEIVRFLLEAQADPLIRDRFDGTPKPVK